MQYFVLPYKNAVNFSRKVFAGYGFSEEECAAITEVLLCADLFGIESHGIQRMMRYHNEIQWGMVDLSGKPEVVHETPLSAVWDANKFMGQIVAKKAMQTAIDKAKTSGIGILAVRNSNHYGIAGYYADMAAQNDLIGICLTNTEAIGVPTFGKRAMLGTNPISFAFPADPVTFLFDAATTVVPRGKLEVYCKGGKPLPDGWAIDAKGASSSNSEEILQNIINKAGGGIAPLGGVGDLYGGHKGYGLGAIVDICCGILSQGMTSNHVSVRREQASIAHFFMVMDYGLFGDKAAIRKNLSVFLQELRDSDKADGKERIFTHGEKEFESRSKKLVEGIPVNEKTIAELQEISKFHGIKFADFFDIA